MVTAPTPFTTSVVSPDTATMFRSTPYISPSEFRFAPTSVATNTLVFGSNAPSDSLASLAQVISRASGEIDSYCFHRGEGTLAATETTESGYFTLKPDGSISIICNFKPVLEVIGVGVGAYPSQVQSLTSGEDISISNKVITIPNTWTSGVQKLIASPWPSVNGQIYAVWTYVNGFPHVALNAAVTAGDTSITVTPSTPAGTVVNGVYAGTALTIHDGAKTEVVVASAAPTGLTISLKAGTQYAHTVPTQPDFIRVSAIPWEIEQACISLTSFYVKAQGNRSMELPKIGTPAAKVVAGYAGASQDYATAMRLLKPFQVAYIRP